MKIPKLLLTAPVLTASGYGVHSRQILRALVRDGRFDVYVEPTRWGDTPFILDESVEGIRAIIARGVPQKPDIAIQVTIPNEFKRRAPLNIGITAGIEVDRVSPEWLVKCNSEVDLVIVPSQHSANGFGAQYSSPDGSQQLSLYPPITVAAEGVDTSVYKPGEAAKSQLLPEDLPEKNFIFVGLGLDKPHGLDRKNVTKLIEWFSRAFVGRSDVGLILKTSIVNASTIDFEVTKRRITDIKTSTTNNNPLPRITLLHGRLTEEEMAGVYRDPRVTAAISLTHGEGFGLPLIEAAACDLPIIATDWSGHIDFLTKDGRKLFAPVQFDLAPIPQECYWQGVMEPGSCWANPKEADAVDKMTRMFTSSSTPRKWAQELGEHVRTNYSLDATGNRLAEVIWSGWEQVSARKAPTRESLIAAMRESVRSKGPSLVYTMPMSAGDVFLSLSIVDALREKHPTHRIYFATSPQYFDIVRGHRSVDEVAEWLPWMQDVGVLEDVFDHVYTPNLAVQMVWSNWVHKGQGRNLIEEFAAQCNIERDRLPIPVMKSLSDDELTDSARSVVSAVSSDWVAVHSGGQKSARAYAHWRDIIANLRENGVKVVQVGAPDDISVGEVDLDARGATKYNELPNVLRKVKCFVGIDSFPMHLAASLGTPTVAIFGSSYAKSTGPGWPVIRGRRLTVLETHDRHGCERACYKDQCKVDASNPCINEIDPEAVWGAVMSYVTEFDRERKIAVWKEHRPKIGGYIHILNPRTHGYPYVESIYSMMGFCDEVVVVDGGSTDGSVEELRDRLEKLLGEGYPEAVNADCQLRIETHQWDPEEPGMDGMQKAFGRAMCSQEMEFLWQQDADEIVHPSDFRKIVDLAKRFPSDVDVLHLPVIELWGDDRTCRTDRHSWKWRLSRNNFRVTHGINIKARLMDPKTGRFYAKKGASDGCEMIDMVSGEFLPHRGFYNDTIEGMRRETPEEYGKAMNGIFKQLPSVWHYSWADLPRKVRNFRDFWDKQWQVLYQTPPEPRFPDVVTEEDVLKKAEELKARGGEHGPADTFQLDRDPPPIMRK